MRIFLCIDNFYFLHLCVSVINTELHTHRVYLMKRFLQFSLFLLIFVSISTLSYGQDNTTATVRGSIYENKSRQPVLYTNIQLEGTTYGAVTDVNGYFTISKVPPGSYTILITYIGFDTLRHKVTLRSGDIYTKKFYLIEGAYELTGATISAEKQTRQSDPTISVTKISTKQMNRIPTIGGQADIAQYLQVVPGVVFTGDQGGQLYIRGGTPVQNLVLLDGMIIYNPFHSIGLFSVFDADIISSADVYTGGFGAEYGGRISSVMDINTRYGNPMRQAGKIDVNSFGAKILIEGPLIKAKDENSGSLSYLISAKKSYIDKTSETLYPYVNEGGGLPFTFSDFYGKLSFNSASGTRADVFGFNFNDQVSYRTIQNYEWKSYGGGMRFTIIPGASPMLLSGNVSYSNYYIALTDGSLNPRSSEVGGFNMGLNFTYFLGKQRVKYGVEMKGFNTNFVFYNILNRKTSQEESTTEIAGYLSARLRYGHIGTKKKNDISRIIIMPGLRVHYYASLADLSFEPRLAMKYNISPDLRVKLAAGLYSQNLISTASDRDVVNLFYGFISGPDDLPSSFNGEEITHKLQKSKHLIFGVEYDLGKRLTTNIEGYIKWYDQLTNLNRNKVFDDVPQYSDKPDVLKKDFIIETGKAQGVDMSIKYDYRRLYVWFVYSLGYSTRFDGIVEYNPHFDRRHNINFLTSYIMGKSLSWEISFRWNYGSGFPFTPTLGNYEQQNFQGGIGTDYTTSNGSVGIIYGDLSSSRLPDYHRLDFGLKRKFVLGENALLEIAFSITNVYDRNNIFYIDRITNERVDQLPILPSLGMSFKF